VSVSGLTSHSTHNRSFRGRFFPDNRLQWYWQPNNNKEEMHKTPNN